MKTDIQIAQEAELMPHQRRGSVYRNCRKRNLEFYGKYKAKLSDELWENVKDNRKDGKLVLVTAINPTPAGEGKTTTHSRSG